MGRTGARLAGLLPLFEEMSVANADEYITSENSDDVRASRVGGEGEETAATPAKADLEDLRCLRLRIDSVGSRHSAVECNERGP